MASERKELDRAAILEGALEALMPSRQVLADEHDKLEREKSGFSRVSRQLEARQLKLLAAVSTDKILVTRHHNLALFPAYSDVPDRSCGRRRWRI